jgi:hypothetical protein
VSKIEPTREAVLAFITKDTQYARARQETRGEDGRNISPFRALTLVDMAVGLGAETAWRSDKPNNYLSQVRTQINIPKLEALLDELAGEDLIVKATGKNSIAGVNAPYGARAGTVWYVDGAQKAWAAKRKQAKQEADLRVKAQEHVLAAHADEVEATYQELLAIQYALDMGTR